MPTLASIDAIDAALGTIRRLNADTARQLATVHTRITELQHHETNLLAATEHRRRKADRLLDERNRATVAERVVRA